MNKDKSTPLFENMKHTFRAFRNRNYRLFFGGQGISLVGTWLQQIAMGWLVYSMTNSKFLLGFVSFSGQIPLLFLTPLAGVLSDRLNRRTILIITQTLSMVQALILSVLVLTGNIQVWHIIVLSIFLGTVNGFDMPIRQAFVVEMVEKREDLSNAIALNSAMFNGARFIGPSIGGLLIAVVGEGMCFLLNGISYIAVIIALFQIRTKFKKREVKKEKILTELKEGFKYTFGFPPLRDIILFIALVSLTAMPYAVIMPVFAKDILHGGPQSLGFLMTAVGAGALTGALYLASRKNVLGLGKIIAGAALFFGTGLILFSISRLHWLSLVILYFTGIGMMIQTASCNTLLQTITDDDKRGRVMSFYSMSFMGMAPFGSLLVGFLSDRISAPATVAIGGICCILAGVLFSRRLPDLRKLIHPIYIRKGIIKEIEIGLESAAQLTRPPDA